MVPSREPPAVVIDRLMEWASRAAAGIDWSQWRLDPNDRLLTEWMPGTPPLTASLAADYGRLHAWLAGRTVAADVLERYLLDRWADAAARRDFALVSDVIADVLLWSQLLKLAERDRETLRAALLWRHPVHAPTRAPAFAPAVHQTAAARTLAQDAVGRDLSNAFLKKIGDDQLRAGLSPLGYPR